MKSTLTYMVVGIVSFMLLFQIALVTFIVKPEMFGVYVDIPLTDDTGIENTENIELLPDDTSAIAAENFALQELISQKDSMLHVLKDSVGTLLSFLEAEKKNVESLRVEVRNLNGKLENLKIETDQNFAKIIESMDAEDAVRVLSTLDDGKVRSVLLTVNRRQAARIMSHIEPDRAARIINYSTDGND